VHAAPAQITGQLARWGNGRDPGICPLTQGLSPSFNEFVSARISAVAASVGAPVQAAGCRPHNVLIFFTTKPEELLAGLVKQDSRILGYHYRQDLERLTTIKHPIQGWYITKTRGWRGDESIDEPEPLLPLSENILEGGKHPAGLPGSRLSASTSSSIAHVVIVADMNKLIGYEWGAVADYLAVLTLTKAVSPEQCGTLPSILDMLLPNCGTEKLAGITAGDLAFLRGLYKVDLEGVLPLERGAIEASMTQELVRR
jgi:hypothetical protein